VVVVVEVLAVGRSDAHADNAAFTFGLEVSSALGNVVLVELVALDEDGRVGSATP
jgi:hypothetical protein